MQSMSMVKKVKSHYVDTHVDDEIEVEDENETTFAIVAKCEENIAMEVVEDMNEATVNVEFYVELHFLRSGLQIPSMMEMKVGMEKFP
jgi:hypothetical protein